MEGDRLPNNSNLDGGPFSRLLYECCPPDIFPFIIRIKRRKFVTVVKAKKRGAVEELGVTDAIVEEWGVTVRLIVSDKPEEDGEPWYLITNDTTSTREQIIDHYYHRFEIEEFFRDTKRLLGLERHQMKSVRSLSILLWFVILGTWFFHFCIDLLSAAQREERKLGLIVKCDALRARK
jgi:IS4 transposase